MSDKKPRLQVEHSCYCYNEECNQKEWEKQGKEGKRKYTVVSELTYQGAAPKCPYCKNKMTITCGFGDGDYW